MTTPNDATPSLEKLQISLLRSHGLTSVADSYEHALRELTALQAKAREHEEDISRLKQTSMRLRERAEQAESELAKAQHANLEIANISAASIAKFENDAKELRGELTKYRDVQMPEEPDSLLVLRKATGDWRSIPEMRGVKEMVNHIDALRTRIADALVEIEENKKDIIELVAAIKRLNPSPTLGNPLAFNKALSRFTLEELTK